MAVAVKNAEEQLRVIRAQALEPRETWSKLNVSNRASPGDTTASRKRKSTAAATVGGDGSTADTPIVIAVQGAAQLVATTTRLRWVLLVWLVAMAAVQTDPSSSLLWLSATAVNRSSGYCQRLMLRQLVAMAVALTRLSPSLRQVPRQWPQRHGS